MDSYELHIGLRPQSRGSSEPPSEGPLAHRKLLGQPCDLDGVFEVSVDVLLHVPHYDVVVRPLPNRSQVRQLTEPGIDEEGLCGGVGPLPPAEALNQVEDQVEEGGCPP